MLLAFALAAPSPPAVPPRSFDALADTHPDFKVTVTGQGRPVVFIPGLATPGDIWQPAVDQLKATCQCHVLSLAGFGGVKPTGANPFLLARARRNHRLHPRQQARSPVIVGHSLGGTMALWVAATAPELPGRLLIVDAMPFMAAIMDPAATVESARAQIAPMVAQVADVVARRRLRRYQQTMIPQWVSSPEQAKRIAAETSKSDPKTVGRALSELMSMDLRGDLGKITCPTLVLGAMADKILYATKDGGRETFHKQYAALRGVRFEMFDRAKHFIMVDDPAGFQKALDGRTRGEIASDGRSGGHPRSSSPCPAAHRWFPRAITPGTPAARVAARAVPAARPPLAAGRVRPGQAGVHLPGNDRRPARGGSSTRRAAGRWPPSRRWSAGCRPAVYGLSGGNWEIAWRLPSLLAAVALVVLLWRAGEQLWPGWGGTLAAAAFGFNVLTPRLAMLVRTDAVLTLWITLLGLIVWRHVRDGGRPWTTRTAGPSSR